MKQQLKYLSFCFLILGFASCDDDEALIETRDVGANAVLVDRSITVLDQNEDITIDLFSNNVNFETVTIQDPDGNELTTANISDGTATFSTSELGDFAFGENNDEETGSFDFRIVSTLSNGEILNDPASISVDHAVSLEDNPTETTLDSLSTVELGYAVSTFGATVDDVTLSVKKGSEETYQETSIDLSTEEGTVELSEIDMADLGIALEVNDTLYYQFTATSGTLSDSVESHVAIVPKAFTNTNSATRSNDAAADELNLWTGEISAEEGEIVFLDPRGFAATTDSDIMFVQVDEDYWESADVLSARAEFEAGTPLSTISPVTEGEVYVYMVNRDVEDEDGNVETLTYYGVIQIGDIVVVNDSVVSFDVNYMEGR